MENLFTDILKKLQEYWPCGCCANQEEYREIYKEIYEKVKNFIPEELKKELEKL